MKHNTTTKASPHNRFKIVATLSLLLALFLLFAIRLLVLSANTPSSMAETTRETNRRSVERLLQIAKSQRQNTYPDNITESTITRARVNEYMRTNPDCWKNIIDNLASSTATYTITARLNGNTVNARDVDDSIITIHFDQGNDLFMIFYQGTLVDCRPELE